MKFTKKQLKRIIKEELTAAMKEGFLSRMFSKSDSGSSIQKDNPILTAFEDRLRQRHKSEFEWWENKEDPELDSARDDIISLSSWAHQHFSDREAGGGKPMNPKFVPTFTLHALKRMRGDVRDWEAFASVFRPEGSV